FSRSNLGSYWICIGAADTSWPSVSIRLMVREPDIWASSAGGANPITGWDADAFGSAVAGGGGGGAPGAPGGNPSGEGLGAGLTGAVFAGGAAAGAVSAGGVAGTGAVAAGGVAAGGAAWPGAGEAGVPSCTCGA